MASDRTIERLQDAGDLLGMLEEIVATGEPSRLALAGMRVAIRSAREGIVRSYLELKQNQQSEVRPSARQQQGAAMIEQEVIPAAPAHDEQDSHRMLVRRDLRASVEKTVDRGI
jgi:hypothetical protein